MTLATGPRSPSLLALPGAAPRLSDRLAGRDNNFNAIRFLAASGVLISHAYPLGQGADAAEPLSALLPGTDLGGICVIAFFAISGFFITKSLAERQSASAFLLARALRLMPALAVVLTLSVLVLGPLVTTAPAGAYWRAAPDYLLRNLTLFRLRYDLPGVFAANPYPGAINGSLWTLSYEVTWYAAVLAAGLLGILRRKAWFAACVAGFALLYLADMRLALNYRIETTITLGLPFVAGMAFWIWRDRIPLSLSLGLGLVVLTVLLRATPAFLPALALSLAYLVFLAGLARLPAWARFARRSDYSYGMYVYAFPVQQVLAFYGVTQPLALMALAFPLTLGLAAASWHLVEAPALALLRRGRPRA